MIRTDWRARALGIACAVAISATAFTAAGVAAIAGPGTEVAAGAVAPPPAFDAAFAQLKIELGTSGGGLVGALLKKTTLALVVTAQVSADAGLVCAAIAVVQKIEATDAALLAALLPAEASLVTTDLLNLVSDLLGDVRSAVCGGSTTQGSSGPGVAVGVVSSNAKGLQVQVAFPPPVFQTKTGGGTSFTEMTDPGVTPSSLVGEPEIPIAPVQFAVPLGANVSVQVIGTSGYDMPGVTLWPAQQSDLAAEPAPGPLPSQLNPPFAQDKTTYASPNSYPASLAASGPVTGLRDLQSGSITGQGARFTPALHLLHVITGATLQVTFGGPNQGVFGSSEITDVWERDELPVYATSFVNMSAVLANLGPEAVPESPICGEQLLIVASAETINSATTLAAARNADGVLTRVVNVGTGPLDGTGGEQSTPASLGQTPTTIRNYIAGQAKAVGCVHPSYVLLMGDSQPQFSGYVPTWDFQMNNAQGQPDFAEPDVASDRAYGFLHQAAQVDAAQAQDNAGNGEISDFGSDVAVGRITGDGPETMAAVAKIISYEDNPTTQASFYQDATSAAWFEDGANSGCPGDPGGDPTEEARGFLEFAQTEIDTIDAAGKSVDRQWSKCAGDSPTEFNDGTSIPSGVQFDQSDGSAGIVADLDQGRFLAIHNDHGFGNGEGWANPQFVDAGSELGALTNANLYPVLWSLDCDSGDFDRHVVSDAAEGNDFSQAALEMPNAGAVGEVASTRQSYISFDGTLGGDLAATVFPTSSPQVNRLGDTTDAALATAILAYPGNGGVPVSDLEYTTFGDPSMYMWTAVPKHFNVKTAAAVVTDSTHVLVNLPNQSDANGANVSLVRGSQYLGRAVLSNGAATITSVEPLTGANASGLQVIFEKDDYVSGSIGIGAPTITAVSPATGPTTGGTPVTITGTGFTTAATLHFGGINAPFTIVNDGTITTTAPAGLGTADISIVNVSGTSPLSPSDKWGWTSVIDSINPTTATNGNTVTISGVGFAGVTGVSFGTTPATSFTPIDVDHVSAVVPAGTGQVPVTVTTAAGPSTANTPTANVFTYSAFLP